MLSIHCFNALQKNNKCIDLEVSYYMICETKIESNDIQMESNNLYLRKKRLARNECSQFDREIVNTDLPYRLNQQISTDPSVTPDLLQSFGLHRQYNKTCWYTQLYRRRCGHLKYYQSRSLTAEECKEKCLRTKKYYGFHF